MKGYLLQLIARFEYICICINTTQTSIVCCQQYGVGNELYWKHNIFFSTTLFDLILIEQLQISIRGRNGKQMVYQWKNNFFHQASIQHTMKRASVVRIIYTIQQSHSRTGQENHFDKKLIMVNWIEIILKSVLPVTTSSSH